MGKEGKPGELDAVMPWEEGEVEKTLEHEERLRKGKEVGKRLIAEAEAAERAEIQRQVDREMAAEAALEKKMYKPGKTL